MNQSENNLKITPRGRKLRSTIHFPLKSAVIYIYMTYISSIYMYNVLGWTPKQKQLMMLMAVCSHNQIMDCSPAGSSVHVILQARLLQWVIMPSSRGSSQPWDQTHVSCTAADSLLSEPPGKSQDYLNLSSICRGSPSVSPENLWSRGKALLFYYSL